MAAQGVDNIANNLKDLISKIELIIDEVENAKFQVNLNQAGVIVDRITTNLNDILQKLDTVENNLEEARVLVHFDKAISSAKKQEGLNWDKDRGASKVVKSASNVEYNNLFSNIGGTTKTTSKPNIKTNVSKNGVYGRDE